MRSMNLPQDAIDDALRSLPPEEVEIWEWQQNSVEAFYLSSTQWRWAMGVSPAGAVVSRMAGLDYAAAEVAWRLSGITLSADDFEGVRIMEAAVVSNG